MKHPLILGVIRIGRHTFVNENYNKRLVSHVTAPRACWHEYPEHRVRYVLERLAVEESAVVEGVRVRRSIAWRTASYHVANSAALSLHDAVKRVCEIAGGVR